MYSPWVIFNRQIEKMFEKDPEVTVRYSDEDDYVSIKLYVDNRDKADALARILPTYKKFGNKSVLVSVIPANIQDEYLANYFEVAFDGNEAFSHLTTVKSPFMSNPISYCVFKKEVVQYPNDNIGDEHGVCSTLYQHLASEIFGEVDGVYFCTDVE